MPSLNWAVSGTTSSSGMPCSLLTLSGQTQQQHCPVPATVWSLHNCQSQTYSQDQQLQASQHVGERGRVRAYLLVCAMFEVLATNCKIVDIACRCCGCCSCGGGGGGGGGAIPKRVPPTSDLGTLGVAQCTRFKMIASTHSSRKSFPRAGPEMGLADTDRQGGRRRRTSAGSSGPRPHPSGSHEEQKKGSSLTSTQARPCGSVLENAPPGRMSRSKSTAT